jgi:response regulator RpfG family c-di-GMP phosphodiesterase
VTRLAEALAFDMRLGRAEAAAIGEAARLRDIGQLPVPDEVLRKAEPLTAGEWKWIRAHPHTGCRMLKELTGSAP